MPVTPAAAVTPTSWTKSSTQRLSHCRPPVFARSCHVVTGTACGRLRSVSPSSRPFHQVYAARCNALFLPFPRISRQDFLAGRKSGLHTFHRLLQLRRCSGLDLPRLRSVSQRLLLCNSNWQTKTIFCQSSVFLFEAPLTASVPCCLRTGCGSFSACTRQLLFRPGEMTGLAPSGGDVPYRPE